MSVKLTDALLDVANGGTGATTHTAHGVLLGNGTGAIAATAAGTTGQVLVGVTGGNPTFGNWLPQAKFKSAQQNVISSTTLVDCTGMSFEIGANEVWMFLMTLACSSNSTAGFKFTFTLPSGATGSNRSTGTSAFSYADQDITLTNGSTVTYSGTASQQIYGNVTNGSTAGTVQFKFAQNASLAANTSVLKSSQLIAWRVS